MHAHRRESRCSSAMKPTMSIAKMVTLFSQPGNTTMSAVLYSSLHHGNASQQPNLWAKHGAVLGAELALLQSFLARLAPEVNSSCHQCKETRGKIVALAVRSQTGRHDQARMSICSDISAVRTENNPGTHVYGCLPGSSVLSAPIMAPPVDSSASAINNHSTENDLDPAAFLKSVRELSERRGREDSERYRELEKEVEESRAARAARRAERARSISPQKAHFPTGRSINTSPLLTANVDAVTASPALAAPKTSQSPEMDATTSRSSIQREEDIPDFKGFGSLKRSSTESTAKSAQVTASHNDSSRPTPSATSLARSGTLSWQRRPNSIVANHPTTSISPATNGHIQPSSNAEPDLSRDQISAALGSRDPAWFRQTADRGIGSAAYRKSKDEVVPGGDNGVVQGRRGLPGLSQSDSIEQERQSSPAQSEDQKSEISRPSSTRDSAYNSTRVSTSTTASTPNKPDLKSLIAADESQLQASPLSDRTSTGSGEQSGLSRTLTMSSSQARLAEATAERPRSPTKGMGGFVQSAMMKRSDSVSKRWSVQQGTSGFSRPTASRSPFAALHGSQSMPKLDPSETSRENSNEPASRPSSSSSNLVNLASTARGDEADAVNHAPSHHNRSKSVASVYTTNADDAIVSPPASPGKRWRSPTKSSWIESALNQPESPRSTPARNSQPSWMANIAKAKAQKASMTSALQSDSPTPVDKSATGQSPAKSATPFGSVSPERSGSREPTLAPRSSSPPVHPKLTDVDTRPTNIPFDAPQLSASRTEHKAVPIANRVDDTATETARTLEEDSSKTRTQDRLVMPEEATSQAYKSSLSIAATKSRPEAPPKPQTDFRSTLRSRGPVAKAQEETPEFLSKFNQLRKAQTEKYVAPDVLKANITRGKSELVKTDGPVKTVRKDELKESLLAKKEDIKKAKEEGRDLPGQAHDRKISNPPTTPSKPEALAKREVLGRSVSTKTLKTAEKPDRNATPEALAKHKALKTQTTAKAVPVGEQPKLERLSKQVSAPAAVETKSNEATSKLAARFNPGLAGILARGPPSNSVTNTASRSGSSGSHGTTHVSELPAEPVADGAPLQDMRKGRAKGPKRRNGGTTSKVFGNASNSALPSEPEPESAIPSPTNGKLTTQELPASGSSTLSTAASQSGHALEGAKSGKVQTSGRSNAILGTEQTPSPSFSIPRAASGSAASVMQASLGKTLPLRPESEKPSPPAKSPAAVLNLQKNSSTPPRSPKNFSRPRPTPAAAQTDAPEFHGVAPSQSSALPKKNDEDKENSSRPLPWSGTSALATKSLSRSMTGGIPAQMSRKDEEAAMRSANLLARSTPNSPSRTGLGISVAKINGPNQPPKPAKSSRVVSGQLHEASPNKDLFKQHEPEALRVLRYFLGVVPTNEEILTIDTRSVMSESSNAVLADWRTLNRKVQEISADGTFQALQAQAEYTLYEKHAYICVHTYAVSSGVEKTQLFAWIGRHAAQHLVAQTQAMAKKISRERGAASNCTIFQGQETNVFLQAIGGILVTRRGARQDGGKQYLLCGRKHQGQLTFDEADLAAENLIPGFACLVSYPLTQRQTRFYLWKGAAASAEEVSAARLAAMDLSESGDIIEVDGGAEFASFLRTFGPGTKKSDLPLMTDIWQQKAAAPNHFVIRLYRIQQLEVRPGMLSLFGRRPSWNQSASSTTGGEIKVEVKHISPFTQADLEAEGIYLLDTCNKVIVLVGPLFASQPEAIRSAVLTQAILFAGEYKALSLLTEQKALLEVKADDYILLSGVPAELRSLFRYWDEARGLWGTAGLMAGVQSSTRVKKVALHDVLEGMRR
nr:hypothetical protein CFP56_46612 [Quercus suber]